MESTMRIALPLLLCACSDYQLGSGHHPEIPADTGTPQTVTPPTTPTPTTPTTPAPTPTGDTGPAPTCADAQIPVLAWSGSPTFAQQADPTDGSGRPFWDPAADTASFVPVPSPDTGSIPVGRDRAYVATFELTELPVNLSLDLESDDGIWVWVNGTPVGHWGGDWQQEGCVNENAECIVTTEVDPVDVTPLLVVGTNTIAARVSNAVQSSWFELLPLCVE